MISGGRMSGRRRTLPSGRLQIKLTSPDHLQRHLRLELARMSCCRFRVHRDRVHLEPGHGDTTTNVQPRVRARGGEADMERGVSVAQGALNLDLHENVRRKWVRERVGDRWNQRLVRYRFHDLAVHRQLSLSRRPALWIGAENGPQSVSAELLNLRRSVIDLGVPIGAVRNPFKANTSKGYR